MITTYLVIVDNCPIHRFNGGDVRVSNFFYSRWESVTLFYPDTAQNWILLKIVFWKWKLY